MAGAVGPGTGPGAAGGEGDDSLYPIAVLIDELRNEDVQVLDWGWGAEASAEAHMVGKREGRLSRGGGSGVGRTIVGVRSGPGAAAVPRWSASTLSSLTSSLRGGGAPPLRQWAGNQFPPRVGEPRWVAGRPGSGGAARRPGSL